MAKSKWANYTKGMQKLPFDLRNLDEDDRSENQYQIDLIKGTIKDRSPIGLATEWLKLRAEEDELNARLKKVKTKRQAYQQVMEESFSAEGVTSLQLDLGKVSYSEEPKAVVKDHPVYQAWCIEAGLLSLLKMPWATTNKMVKERLELGQPCPPGVDVFTLPKFRRT